MSGDKEDENRNFVLSGPGELVIFCQNVQSIRNKVDYVELLLNEEFQCSIPDLLCFTETWLKVNEDQFITFRDYVVGECFSRRIFSHGGVMIMVNKNFHFSFLNHENLPNCIEKDFEYVGIKNSKFTVFCLYRSPDGDINVFFDNLFELLNVVKSNKSNLILCGDFNIDLLKDTKEKTEFLSILSTFNLKPIINTPTRVTSTTCTLLDNFFIDVDNNVTDHKNFYTGVSDHNGVLLKMRGEVCRDNRETKIKQRCFNLKNRLKFTNLVRNADWDAVSYEIHPNEKVEVFYNIFLRCFNAAFPEKTSVVRNNTKPWITKGIRTSAKNKRILLSLKRYSTDDNFINYVKKYVALLDNVVKYSKRLFYNKMILESDNRQKTSWNIINNERNSKCRTPVDNIVLSANDGLISDPTKIANILNENFSNVAERLVLHLPVINDPIENLNKLNLNNSVSMFLYPSTPIEIVSIVNQFKNKKTSGYDEIPIIILKDNIDIFKFILCDIFNSCMQSGIFPDRFKTAIVRPLFKKGNKYDKNNYRPISLLPTFSKILEKLLQTRLVSYLSQNNIISGAQFGFQSTKGTNDAIFEMLNTVYENMQSGAYTMGIFCDLTKAFDCVDHDILTRKLHFYGIRGVANEIFKSYLSNRTQLVEVHGRDPRGTILKYYSKELSMTKGVPQGGVLGPTLFTIFINDLVCSVSCGKFVLFADDTSIIINEKNLNELSATANSAINNIIEWMNDNKLILNHTKTFNMLFKSNRSNISNITLNSGNAIIEPRNDIKFLGVQIDSSLDWHLHINTLIQKLSSYVFLIRKIKETVGFNAAKSVYFSCFASTMCYGLEFWGNSSGVTSIFKIQKRAIRVLYSLKQYESCRSYFSNGPFLTLTNLYIYKIAQLVYKKLPVLMRNYHNHNYSTRNNTDLLLPLVHLSSLQKGPLYSGINIFNKLPHKIKQSISLKTFRKNLKKWLQVNTFYSLQEFFDTVQRI